jgi:hypothetical protein
MAGACVKGLREAGFVDLTDRFGYLSMTPFEGRHLIRTL